jgi:mannosyltransferase OCH1-like enzyme
MIPKYIFQTIPDKTSISEAYRDNIERLRILNPGWNYRLFDNAEIYEFISTHYGSRILKLYERINPDYGPARADFFRYLLIYALGGVYLDIKSGISKPLDFVLSPTDTYLLSHWRNAHGESHAGWGLHSEVATILPRGEYVNWFVISQAGHPFLRQVIEHVCKRIERYDSMRDGLGKLAVLRTTGPIAYSLAIEEIRKKHPHRLVEYADIGLIYSIFESSSGAFGHIAHHPGTHYTQLGTPVVRHLNRNDSCPCGSGKKYKLCHGKLNT